METLQQQIKNQIKEAMMAKDAERLSVLRGLSSSITNDLVDKGRTPSGELTDEEVLALIRRAVKQRKDSIEQFTTGGREDLAAAEKAELAYLEVYLPQMMAYDEVLKIVAAKKEELAITDAKDKGKLMSEIMKDLKGKAEGMDVKNAVDSLF